MKNLTKWLFSAFLIVLFGVVLGNSVVSAAEVETGGFSGKFVSFRSVTDESKAIELDTTNRLDVLLSSFENRDTQKWAMIYAGPYQAYMISHLSILGAGYLGEVSETANENGTINLLSTIGDDCHWRLISAGEYDGQPTYYIENMTSGRVITRFGAGHHSLFTSTWQGTEDQKFFVQVETN